MKKLWRILSGCSDILNLSSNAEKLVKMQTADFLGSLTTVKSRLQFSEEEIQHFQNERLRQLLSFTKKHSPWYQKILAKIDVNNFTQERLIEIPPLNRTILMDNWDLIVTNPKLSLHRLEKHIEKMNIDENVLFYLDRFHVLTTSKTTGKHGVFIYDWEEWNEYCAHFLRYRFYDNNTNKIKTHLKIAQIIVCNMVYAAYAFAKSYNFNHVQRVFLPVTLPTDQIVSELNRIQPQVLEGTPSTLYRLCHEATKGNLHIEPKMMFVTGEVLYKSMRKYMKMVWPDCNIFNIYGTSEGLGANNCCADSEVMHLNEDACIVEPLDENNQPLARPNQASKLYLTNLYNKTLPLIRYEMSDKLRFLDKKCECGSKHQLIEEPQGRLEYDFIYAGNVFIHHLVFVTPLLFEKNILEYQVLQTINGADIKIVADGFVDKERLIKDISNNLINLGLVKPEINLFEVREFNYPPSGKLRRFIKLG